VSSESLHFESAGRVTFSAGMMFLLIGGIKVLNISKIMILYIKGLEQML
jgi:hypothetical protein